MDKTISNVFFSIYSFGGIMDNCIRALRERYDLEIYQKKKELPEKWREYYNKILPKEIERAFNEFDESIITNSSNNSLFDEIENNILELKETEQQKRYIHSILSNFKNLSDIFHPKLSHSSYYYKNALENDSLEKSWKNASDKEEAKKQLEAIEIDRTHRKGEIERLIFISGEFRKIRQKNYSEIDITERVFNSLLFCKEVFTNRLDALLLKHKLDLLEIQKECNIYLKTGRNITDIDFYLGSINLAERYIQELPKPKNNETPKEKDNENTEKKYPAKYYALLHWIKIELGLEVPFELNSEGRYSKKSIRDFARTKYTSISDQQFYKEFRDLDITNKAYIATIFGRDYKKILTKISGNNAKIISYLKDLPN